jgi:hypothetical protein
MIQGGFDDLTALTPIHSPVVPFGLRSKQNWGLCPVQPRHRLRRWARTAAATTRYSIFCVKKHAASRQLRCLRGPCPPD